MVVFAFKVSASYILAFLFQDSYERAKHILKTHAKEHKNLAEALLTYETLDAKEIQIVLEGKKLELRWYFFKWMHCWFYCENISSTAVVSFCNAFRPFMTWYHSRVWDTLSTFCHIYLSWVILTMTPIANQQLITNMLKKIKNYQHWKQLVWDMSIS